MLYFKLTRPILRASIIAMIFVAGTPARAAGPSFACYDKQGPVERAICGDSDLADLDDVMATSFLAAMKRNPIGKTALLERQRRWLASRQAECNLRAFREATSDNRLCLHAIYTARIATLDATIPH